MVSMRAAGITSIGGAVVELDLPEPTKPRAGEVTIAVRAAGVGNWDDIVRRGEWDVGRVPPMALGVEAAGVVVAAGAAVTGIRLGDEVMTHPLPLRDQGAWAERLLVAAELVAPKPAGMSWEAAGAFPVPALTAAQALAAVGIGAGDSLLVSGAGGVTGGMIVELALARGAAVIATAGPESTTRLRRLGVRVLDRQDPGWPEHARKLAGGHGTPATVNAIRGGSRQALRATADGGRLATITGDPPAAERQIAISNVYVRPDGVELAALADLLASGLLTIEVAALHPLSEAAAALAAATSGRAGGAVVLRPDK